MLENFLSSPLLYSLALTLMHFVWQGCMVALVLKCVLAIIPHQKAQARYLASSVAMLAHFLMPISTFFWIYQPHSLQQLNPLEFLAVEHSVLGISTDMSNAWSHSLLEFAPYISLAWLAVVLLLVSKLLLELYNVHQLPKHGIVPTNEQLQQRFVEFSQQLKITKTPRLLISLKVKVPMAIGWLKPVVIIPASMLSGLTPAQLDMLILHELAHIRRHDYLVNFLQTLVETLLFFHPCVHWVAKKMRNEREYCSDDIAVHHCGNPVAYAHTLADTASHCKKHRAHTIPSIAMAASGGDLKQRVLRLIDHHHCVNENQTAKLLTSVAIIATLALVALSQFIHLPMYDFNSGQLLFKPESISRDVSSYQTEQQLSQTSIAQNLLEQDTVLAPTVVISNDSESLAKEYLSENNAAVDNDIVLPRQNPSAAELQQKDVVAYQPTTVKAVIDESTTEKVVVEPAIAKNESFSITEHIPSETPSKVESAFERTNSSNNNSVVNNPYALQIASLSEDVPADDVIAAEPLKQSAVQNNYLSFNSEPENTVIANQEYSNTPVAYQKSKATLIKSVDPKYPSAAKRRGIELDIFVSFTIDTNGKVKDIFFERKNKMSYFKSSVKNAMSKWRFIPAKENDKAVESKMSKIFSFSLTH
ncbi:M56 family metallopeptidase [Thalassotalea sp. PLHSN55]|uniref:M56 family metallopeptidase n=1 Tax=Thalassotalea sp. PLHSN55 TaxID=3435888 RepID=UPI003F848A05